VQAGTAKGRQAPTVVARFHDHLLFDMTRFAKWACGIVALVAVTLIALTPGTSESITHAGVPLVESIPDLAPALVGTLAFGFGLTLKRGATLDEATPADIVFEDVSDILTWRRPQDSPLYVLLRNLRNGDRAEAAEVKWQEVGTIPRTTTTTGSTTAGNADSTKQIPVADDIYQAEDVLYLPENSNDPGARLIVDSVSSGNVTVYKVDGGSSTTWGTVPALADGEKIVRLGNAKTEFYERSPFRSTYPQEYSNYIQRMDEVVGISRTKQATEDYAGDSWQQQRDNQIWDFQTSRESMLFFGTKQKKDTTGGNLEDGTRGFMGGIDYYGPGHNLSYSASSFDTGKLLDMVRRTFVGNTGSDIRYLHADSMLIQDIMQLDDDLRQRPYESQQLRRQIPEIDMGFGQLRVIHENLFDEMGLSRYGFILDYSNVRLRELNPMKVKRLELEEQDGMGVQIKEEVTCEWRYLDTHAKIEGSS